MSVEPRARSEGSDHLIGEVLAERYRVQSKLGEGAMGAVYRATHVKVGRPFAIKVLHPRLLEDDKIHLRFEREAELAGRLHHPNVIGVVDVGETAEGLRYMVMDFAQGPDLSTLLEEAPLKPQRIIHIVRQLLDGLFHAHSVGLIHRDFKPENVIVEKDAHGHEVPRIVDFGIAILREGGDSSTSPGRLTTNGLVLGTPHYMAPEQAVNDPIDHRIDLFALGIMVYELLCGKLPFDGTGVEIARANLMFDPPPIAQRVPHLEVDPLLEAFARTLMAKQRDDRPATAKAAREVLDLIDRDRAAAATALGVSLAAVSLVPRMTEPVAPPRRHTADDAGTFPPPLKEPGQPAPMVAPVAHAESVQAPTDELEPEPRRSKRGVIIGASVGGVLLAGVLGVSLLGGGSPKPAPVAQQQPAPAPVANPAPPVVAPPPAPAPAPIASAGSAGSAEAIAGSGAAPVASADPAPTPTRDHKHRGTPKRVAAAAPVSVPAVTAPPIATTPVAAVATAPAPSGPYNNKAFLAQLKSVGQEIATFGTSHPNVDIVDLQTRYSTVTAMYNDAMTASNQPARDKAHAALDQIHAALAKRLK